MSVDDRYNFPTFEKCRAVEESPRHSVTQSPLQLGVVRWVGARVVKPFFWTEIVRDRSRNRILGKTRTHVQAARSAHSGGTPLSSKQVVSKTKYVHRIHCALCVANKRARNLNSDKVVKPTAEKFEGKFEGTFSKRKERGHMGRGGGVT